jgi:hypothetical protein
MNAALKLSAARAEGHENKKACSQMGSRLAMVAIWSQEVPGLPAFINVFSEKAGNPGASADARRNSL